MVNIGGTVNKVMTVLIALVVLGIFGGAVLTLVTSSTGEFRANSALDNATGNDYTSLITLVPTLAILGFIILLVGVAIAMFKGFGKHR